MSENNPVLATALNLAGHGMSVIPIKPGAKTPPIPWKQYQAEPAGDYQVYQWFTHNPTWGVGVITGTVSGNLVMIELEARGMEYLPRLASEANRRGINKLWMRLLTGWVEQTPSGGIHFHARITLPDGMPMPGNTKFARATDNHPLAETRGEGGLTVVAPTPGTCHPTGRPWKPYTGSPANTPTITWDEYQAIGDLLATIDQTPKPEPATPPVNRAPEKLGSSTPTPNNTGDSPGDAYEKNTTWDDILIPHGWQKVRPDGPGYAWTRPGKHPKDGISATTGRDTARDRLYVFSTSTVFESETPYTKFGAYALLEHGGDHHAAAKALREQGYGRDFTRNIVIDLPTRTNQGSTCAPSDTATATVTVSEPNPSNNGEETSENTAIPVNTGATTATLRDLTEDANALLLLDVHGEHLRHISERNTWLHWNGYAWEPQPRGGGSVRELAKTLARALPTDPKPLKTWRTKSLTNATITSTLNLAATDPRATITQTQLDAHPDEINTPTGIINLRTGAQTPPNPARLHTKTTTCGPNNTMPTPMWNQFLDDTFKGHEAVRDYLQPLLGYCLTGRTGAQILPFFHGSGANGKSVLAEVIVQLMGDYATTAPADFLIRAGGNQHPTEIAHLQGARLITASEVPYGSRFDETKIKQLTGGDTLTARYMHGDFFTFQPTHKIIVLGNDRPKVVGGGYSFWRRFRLIPFENTVPEKDRDPALARKLVETEGPGILAWLIAGAVEYYKHGLTAPAEVLAATERYEAEEDHIGRFAGDRLIIGGGEYVRVEYADMRAAYTNWCETEGIRPLSAVMFTRRLAEKFNIGTAKSNGKRFYTWVNLTTIDDDDREPSPWQDLGGGR